MSLRILPPKTLLSLPPDLLRKGEQTQWHKFSVLGKLLSVCGPMGLFHSDLSAEPGQVGAQPRKECLATKLAAVVLRKHCCHREQRHRAMQGEDVAAQALLCHSGGWVQWLFGNFLCQGKDFLGRNQVISERDKRGFQGSCSTTDHVSVSASIWGECCRN